MSTSARNAAILMVNDFLLRTGTVIEYYAGPAQDKPRTLRLHTMADQELENLRDAISAIDEAPSALDTVDRPSRARVELQPGERARETYANTVDNSPVCPRCLTPGCSGAPTLLCDRNLEERLVRERDSWEKTANEYGKGMEYYRDLVVQVGRSLGDAAYIADDGSTSQDVLCAKVPELVRRVMVGQAADRRDLGATWEKLEKSWAVSDDLRREIGEATGLAWCGFPKEVLDSRVPLIDMVQRLVAAAGERDRLDALLNTPELHDFSVAVVREGAHQRERWGMKHDSGKDPSDWFWLIGYLAGKCLKAHQAGDREKALHHAVTTAAALNNWHAHILTGQPLMRPGIGPEKASA